MKKHPAQKTAIITGASSGIGRATALALARAGDAVVISPSSAVKKLSCSNYSLLCFK